jgi:hypothetical protein
VNKNDIQSVPAIDYWKYWRVPYEAAVPIALAFDFNGVGQKGAAARSEHMFYMNVVAREDLQFARAYVRRAKKQFDRGLFPQPVEIDDIFKQVLERAVIAGIELLGREQFGRHVEQDITR